VSFSLRAMAPEDLDRVLQLAGESSEAPRWTRRDYEQILLATPPDLLGRFSVVALCGERLAGFAVASRVRQEPAAEMEGLVVDQAYRRRRIGSALLGGCMAWAAQVGASMLRLEVRASNAAAFSLYQKHGFSIAGVRRGYYSAPVEDALLLQAPLTPQPPERIQGPL
jgi:[ribosomal protein S18]-alanine N-acetyltransferase